MKRGWILLLTCLVLLFVTFGVITAAKELETSHREAGRQQLEDALRRAAVACYAAEGIYPPTTAYLEEHYGIRIDREKYHVFYEVFAENLMPQITVLLAD